MVVELASDWLVCTCNASLALAAGAASAVAVPAVLSWQLRQAAAWLALRLGLKDLPPPGPPSHRHIHTFPPRMEVSTKTS